MKRRFNFYEVLVKTRRNVISIKKSVGEDVDGSRLAHTHTTETLP